MAGQVAAYLRVSARSQDLATQRYTIERAAEVRGEPVNDWFLETKSAKTVKDRPVLAELRKVVRGGQIGMLYVYSVDRLGRSGFRDMFSIIDEIRGSGCRIVNLTDPFSLDCNAGPINDLLIGIFAWVAQQERIRIGERVADARKRVLSQGGRWGRPRRIDPGTVEKCKILRENGKSIRIIAAEMKIPRSTVSDLLSEKGHYKPAAARAVK